MCFNKISHPNKRENKPEKISVNFERGEETYEWLKVEAKKQRRTVNDQAFIILQSVFLKSKNINS